MDIDIDQSFGVLGKGDQHIDLRYIFYSVGLSVLKSNNTFDCLILHNL